MHGGKLTEDEAVSSVSFWAFGLSTAWMFPPHAITLKNHPARILIIIELRGLGSIDDGGFTCLCGIVFFTRSPQAKPDRAAASQWPELSPVLCGLKVLERRA